MEGGKPKINITGNFLFFPECGDIRITDEKVAEFGRRTGSHFLRVNGKQKGFEIKSSEEMIEETYRLKDNSYGERDDGS